MAEPLSDPDAAELPARDEVIREIAMLSARCCCPRRRREGEYGLNVSEGRVSAGTVVGELDWEGEEVEAERERQPALQRGRRSVEGGRQWGRETVGRAMGPFSAVDFVERLN